VGKLIDLTGKTIGDWHVLSLVPRELGSKKDTIYLCECLCGKRRNVSSNSLRYGKSKRCTSCSLKLSRTETIPKIDLSKFKFGKLKPINYYKNTNYKVPRWFWKCRCDCGNSCEVSHSDLINKKRVSCGCALIGPGNKRWCGYKEISGNYWSQVRIGASKRNLAFDISIEYAWQLFINQNRKCALTDLELTFASDKPIKLRKQYANASLDRIDSQIGYIKSNIQWVHKDINVMKMGMLEEDFILYCKLVARKFNEYSS
jgi:hypothetical protein